MQNQKKVLEWSSEKEEFLGDKVEDDIDIQNLRAKINSFGGFEQELQSVGGIKETTSGFGKELVEEKHESKDHVHETMEKMDHALHAISESTEKKKHDLQELLTKKLEIEQLCVDFAKNSETLYLFLEECSNTISEGTISTSVSDCQNKEKETHSLTERLEGEMHEVLETIKSLHEKVSSQSQNPEAFSRITKSQNEKKNKNTQKYIQKMKKRKSDLENELQKQKDHEKILSSCLSECKEFIQHVEHSLKKYCTKFRRY